ncbi:MAG: hypothetical protein E7672_05310 [Ruminococcaceae bacterium]|nr:hypothetical protein [Oscillospiraceae bacterium]
MGKIIKKIMTAIIFILCGMIIFRCCMVADKSTFKDLYVTDDLKSAYSGGESVMYTVDVKAEISDEGYFSAYGFYYNPEASEAQFAARWNDSAYEYTEMEEGHEYVFYLLNETTGETYEAKCVDSTKKMIYNYRKYIVSDCVIGEADLIKIVMELKDGDKSTQFLKHAEQPLEEYKVKGKLLKELSE